MDLKRARELAEEIEILEDWPGDSDVVECIIALRDEIKRLEQAAESDE